LSPCEPRRTWLTTLIGRCQHVAGNARDLDGIALSALVRSLAVGLPDELTIAERLATRSCLTTLLARTMQTAGLDLRDDVRFIFFEWAACEVTASTWPAAAIRFASDCATVLERAADPPPPSIDDVRIAAALRTIEVQYADPDLSLERVAAQAGLSRWYAARLLKRLTGCGFTTHLHRVRIAAARRLLLERTCCIKEIAAAVGYNTPSQFCWHFKRLVGLTPTAFRLRSCDGRIAG
jgi:AraC-like DNA-binding protein